MEDMIKIMSTGGMTVIATDSTVYVITWPTTYLVHSRTNPD